MQAKNLAIKLQQDVRSFTPIFRQTGAHPERMQDASETCANVTLKLSCTVDSTYNSFMF